jgi:hypothetical protein
MGYCPGFDNGRTATSFVATYDRVPKSEPDCRRREADAVVAATLMVKQPTVDVDHPLFLATEIAG